ncbi:MMPL family transporter [Nonomuraea sp. B1E8]|uniref:MMPL family transporter n=1 Tax=unclassified Nonomuraea TaxID=2593643 RepID=UPI00325D9D68
MPAGVRRRRSRHGGAAATVSPAGVSPAPAGPQQDDPGAGSAALGRLGRAAARRGRLVLAVWLLLAAGSVMLLPGLMQRLVPPSLEVPGSRSAAAAAMIARGLPELGEEQMLLAFSSASLDAGELRFQQAMAATVDALAARPDIGALLPLVVFTIVFGLSLDYEVFLVHRIAEHYRRGGDNTAAVLYGLRHTARPITLAAAIMAVTFGGLMFTRRLDFQQGGFAVAAAIVIDATIIRMVLVPCLMRLLGHRNWWLPGTRVSARSRRPG